MVETTPKLDWEKVYRAGKTKTSRKGYFWQATDEFGLLHAYKVNTKRSKRTREDAQKLFRKHWERQLVEVSEVETQTSFDTRKKGRYNTVFRYTGRGVFENMPKPEKLEKMTKNGLIKAFNSGRQKGRYLQKDLFGNIVETAVRGFEARPKLMHKRRVTNNFDVDIEINNNGSTWRGSN